MSDVHIHLNGVCRPVPSASLISDLLAALGFTGKRIAVELNGHIVPKSRYGSVRLRADDCVEVVVAVGGG